MNEEPELQEESSENLPEKVSQAYRRAAIGLAIAAIGWTLVFLFAKNQDEETKMNWLIPIAAAALSVLCFSRYRSSQYRDR